MFDEQDEPGESGGKSVSGPVYIVEDDEDLRRSLLRLLRAAGFDASAYDRASDFLEDAKSLPPGCVVTDVNMPGIDGLELTRRIGENRLPFSVVVITGQAQIRLAVDAMKAGAADFLEKPFAPEALLQAIRRAGRPAGARAASASPADAFASLSGREREVLADVLSGATNKVIARRLQISPRTVEVYRASVMRKVGAASLSDLVRRALTSGFPLADQPRATRRSGPDAVDGCLQ